MRGTLLVAFSVLILFVADYETVGTYERLCACRCADARARGESEIHHLLACPAVTEHENNPGDSGCR